MYVQIASEHGQNLFFFSPCAVYDTSDFFFLMIADRINELFSLVNYDLGNNYKSMTSMMYVVYVENHTSLLCHLKSLFADFFLWFDY